MSKNIRTLRDLELAQYGQPVPVSLPSLPF
jgi:hypothetical protein